jgi:transposase InsO family protein
LKYAFINRHRRVWPISVLCRVLQASMTGYHEHLVRRTSAAQRRQLSDDALLVHIKVIHAETHGACRWPRAWKELLTQGICVGKERVRKRMQPHGIRAKGKRRFRITTDSGHDLPIAPSLAAAPVHGDKARQVLGG